MILQYDDIVLQTVARLRVVIPPTAAEVQTIMVHSQKDIEDFYKSAEKPKLLVTWSGLTAEGGREAKDFVKSIDDMDQYEAHTIEIHIAAKRFMYQSGEANDSILKLAYLVRKALVGLKFYPRDQQGVIIRFDQWGTSQAQTGGMFHMETIIDRQYEGVIVATVRMQVLEMVPQAEEVEPDMIWGTYQEIIFEEYRGPTGSDIQTTGTPDEQVQIP